MRQHGKLLTLKRSKSIVIQRMRSKTNKANSLTSFAYKGQCFWYFKNGDGVYVQVTKPLIGFNDEIKHSDNIKVRIDRFLYRYVMVRFGLEKGNIVLIGYREATKKELKLFNDLLAEKEAEEKAKCIRCSGSGIEDMDNYYECIRPRCKACKGTGIK